MCIIMRQENCLTQREQTLYIFRLLPMVEILD